MKETIDSFNESMDYIRQTIKLNSITRRLLHDSSVPQPSDSEHEVYRELFNLRSGLLSDSAKKRVFDSSLAIVYIYSSFEIYIESLIESYLHTIKKLSRQISMFPNEILRRHSSKSLDFLSNLGRFSNSRLTEIEIIKNIYYTSGGIKGWELNYEAYSAHTANLRLELLIKLFDGIGINSLLSKVRQTYTYTKFYGDNPPDKMDVEFLEKLINARNDISHGWRLDESYSDEILNKMIDDISLLSNSIYEVVNNHLFNILIYRKIIRLSSTKIVESFRNGQVVICHIYKGRQINKGDRIIYIHRDKDHLISRSKLANVRSIHINDIEQDKIQTNVKTEVGLLLDSTVNKGGNVYLVVDKDKMPFL